PRASLTRKWGAPTWPPNPPQTLGAPRQSRGAPRHSDRLLLLGRRRRVGSRRLSRPLEPPGLTLLVEPDRHLDPRLPPVAPERHAHLLADRRRGNDPLQIAWPLARRAVELHDDVVRAHPAALGGFARHDVADQHAARLAQPEPFDVVLGDLGDGHAEPAPLDPPLRGELRHGLLAQVRPARAAAPDGARRR